MPYEHHDNGILKKGKEVTQLTNFRAWITTQTTYHDGQDSKTMVTLKGKLGEEDLPEIEIPVKDLPSIDWPTEHWGVKVIVYPDARARDLAVAIAEISEPKMADVYTATGWLDDQTFLTHGAAIRGSKVSKAYDVRLPKELQPYCIDRNDGHPALLDKLTDVDDQGIMMVMVIAVLRVLVGPVDFALHIAGQTGSFKTEMASLAMSLVGKFDARTLPGSWSSTPNALERQCYQAQHLPIVIDDYVPYGTSWQVRALNKAADQIFRAQGNQQGRARLTDRSGMQETFYPRGIVISTGEDIPQGHSLRSRCLIMEIVPGAVTPQRLTEAQSIRNELPAVAGLWLSYITGWGQKKFYRQLLERKQEIRNENQGTGHQRTPAIIGDLQATAELFAPLLPKEMQKPFLEKALMCIHDHAQQQSAHLEGTDPTRAFLEAIRQALGTNNAHMRTRNGGIPKSPELLGWTQEQAEGELPAYKAHGKTVGWIDWSKQEAYIDPALTDWIKRYSQGRCSIGTKTLHKRLKEAGLLARADTSRQRITCRVTVNGVTRQVLVLDAGELFPECGEED